jgi:hypothetical protein
VDEAPPFQIMMEFDWEKGNLSQMYEFEMEDLDKILNVAIKKVLPQKAKFMPIGANVIFLCTRYAAHELGHNIANECLLTSVYKINNWVEVKVN